MTSALHGFPRGRMPQHMLSEEYKSSTIIAEYLPRYTTTGKQDHK